MHRQRGKKPSDNISMKGSNFKPTSALTHLHRAIEPPPGFSTFTPRNKFTHAKYLTLPSHRSDQVTAQSEVLYMPEPKQEHNQGIVVDLVQILYACCFPRNSGKFPGLRTGTTTVISNNLHQHLQTSVFNLV